MRRPGVPVAIGRVDLPLGAPVIGEVGGHEEIVVVGQVVDDMGVTARLLGGEDAVRAPRRGRRRGAVRRPPPWPRGPPPACVRPLPPPSCRRERSSPPPPVRGSPRWRRRACRWSARRSARISCCRCPRPPCRRSRSVPTGRRPGSAVRPARRCSSAGTRPCSLSRVTGSALTTAATSLIRRMISLAK
jgi:hypothetical protein